MKVNGGLKEREIASILEINQATVKVNLFRARKQLKSELTKVLAEALYIGIDKNEIYKLVKEISALAKGGES